MQQHPVKVFLLMRGLPVTVLQKVLGHAKIQTTMLYAKIVEDFQHQKMRRIWELEGAAGPAATAIALDNPVCAVGMAVA